MRVLSRRLGRRVGGSTGTNFFGLCTLVSRMKVKGALVTLICDSGSDDWIAAQGFNRAPQEQALDAFLDGKGTLTSP